MDSFRDLLFCSDTDIAIPMERQYSRRTLADPLNDFTEQDFARRYRMTKSSFGKLLAILEEDLSRPNNYGAPHTPTTQLLVALRYFTQGGRQNLVGDALGVAQTTVSKIIFRVAKAICKQLQRFIVWPTGADARRTVQEFKDLVPKRTGGARKGMPNVIGAIDGTQIQVRAHGFPNREINRNRHGEIALNVQAVCDVNLRFLDVVARWPGSTHDARILANSRLQTVMESQKIGEKYWLLGDSGYPCRPWLLPPLSNPEPAPSPEDDYQFAHLQTRNVVERAFGLLKKRFECVSQNHIPGQDIDRLPATIMACFILHNFLIAVRDDAMPLPPDTYEVEPYPRISEEEEESPLLDLGFNVRKHLINTYFSS